MLEFQKQKQNSEHCERIVYIASDATGITAEKFATSLLAQFKLDYSIIRIPFIDHINKAHQAVERINTHARIHPNKIILFTTLVNAEINAILHTCPAFIVDLFQAFIQPLEQELGLQSTHVMNSLHHIGNIEAYEKRMEAINFALMHDDGQSHSNLELADIILIGVSRSGKTPTSLYLAMQYGLKAANYPLIPEDFERQAFPKILTKHMDKLFGLTIDAKRLANIRHERAPNTHYASFNNCMHEIYEAEKMMRANNITYLSSTHKSIEEIATTILQCFFKN
jgi:[pyruvate, water dikinase]-phosphate phosphotransferase / [pyruvate, water dikinase] kinase